MATNNDPLLVDPVLLRQAEQFCKQRLKNDPENRVHLRSLAEVHRKQGNLAAGAAAYEQLFRLDPQDQEAGYLQAVLGGKKEMQLTTLKTFSIGPFRFRQVPTYVFDDSYDVTNYPQLGGLIGNDLLRRFNLILNYSRSEIYLVPNGDFYQPFDYSYSGVTIALVSGKIVVTDVMKDSPGNKAGFREGDVVLEVNGDQRQDMQVYQSLLRTIGPRVRVLVRREEGEVAELSLKVKSIL